MIAIKFYDRGFIYGCKTRIHHHSLGGWLFEKTVPDNQTIHCIKLKLYRVDFSEYLNNVNHGVESDYNLIPGIIEWYSLVETWNS